MDLSKQWQIKPSWTSPEGNATARMARYAARCFGVPIVEAAGHTGVGRFGWKDQHASLLSFAGDAYLNEMGITSRLFPTEVTDLCNTAGEPNSTPTRRGSRTSIASRASCELARPPRATGSLRRPRRP